MMEVLLNHLVNITCQRDHALLDSSVVMALRELVGAKQVRVHEMFCFRDELFVRPRVWLADGKIVSAEDSLEADHAGEAISKYPALAESINQRKTCIEEITGTGDHILWLPVSPNDKVSTCIEVVNSTPYSSDTLHMIEGIMCVYRNYQSIIDYSERDSLTGLLNRKTFDEKFSKLLSNCNVDNAPENMVERRHHNTSGIGHWLAVADIDHFKRVNDQFGHLYGDEVLILVANLLRSSFRAQDRVFRFGGEEFVVLLRSTTLEQAQNIFERFRAHVEKHDFPQVGKVTVSVGFASISSESPVIILGHADQALYYAKENGRNRVCHYEELVSGGLLHSGVSHDEVEFF